MRSFLLLCCLSAACSLSSTTDNPSSDGSLPVTPPSTPSLSPSSRAYVSALLNGSDGGSSPLTNGFGEYIKVETNGDILNWSNDPRGHERRLTFIEAVEGRSDAAYYSDSFLYTGVIFPSSVSDARGRDLPIPGVIVLTMDSTGIFQAALDKTPGRDEVKAITASVIKNDPLPVREAALRYYAKGNFKPSVPNSSLEILANNGIRSTVWVPGAPVNRPFAKKP